MTDIQQEMIAKIKKLFAMANRKHNNDGSSNEAEASAAMAKAQEILTKYNLDLKTVQDAVASDVASQQAGGKREKTKINHSAMYRWQQQLWKVIAEANNCFHWVTETQEEYTRGKGDTAYKAYRRVKRHVILGSEANVITVTLMGEYLVTTMEHDLPYPNVERLSNSAISWREGCADRLMERIRDKAARMQREGFVADGQQCTALAVQDLHEKEYAANYDAAYGVGAYARMKQRQADAEKQAAERQKKADEERARTLAGETPAERVKREDREAKAAAKQAAADAKWWARWHRRQERESRMQDVAAYARGSKKGSEINLDSQLKQDKKGQLR